MKLGKLAVVRTGLVLNRKQATINDVKNFEYSYLTLKSINNDASINLDYLEQFQSKEILKNEYLSNCGDIVVRLSYPHTAVLIDENTKGLLIPSHFAIIRCDTNKILPDYLVWLLNNKKMNKKISLSTSTSKLGTIRSSFFSELEIYPISIQNQYKLGQLNELAIKELELIARLKEEKQKYYAFLIDKIQEEMRTKQNDN